jgi:hypothetical protein
MAPGGLHAAKLIVEPGFVRVVDDVFVQQNTGKLGEKTFKVSEMVDFYRLDFCFQFVKTIGKVIKTLFKGSVQNSLLKAVFYKIHSVPGKTYRKDYSYHQQKQTGRDRRKNLQYFVQNVPHGHLLPPAAPGNALSYCANSEAGGSGPLKENCWW